MPIPLMDVVAQYHEIRSELLPGIEQVMLRGDFILGEDVELFEEKYAALCSTDHCVGVSSGTEALHLALRALGVGAGDEVITAANTFAATAFAISYTGAQPVFVDVNPDDYNLDVSLIEQAINERTKAIVPVHLYGQPADMQAIRAIAEEHQLAVVEDASQSHAALYHKQPVGSLGDIGCFSFYPGKNLGGCGDGGAAVTNRPDLAEKIRLLRNYGQPQKNVFDEIGYNARLDTLQAAILLVKLNYLEQWTERRREIAQCYRQQLADACVQLPLDAPPGVLHVYHQFVVQHNRRDELAAHLQSQGISCGIHYPTTLPESRPYRAARTVPTGVPVSRALSRRILSLPVHPHLTDEEIETIVESVHAFGNARVEVGTSG